MQLSPKKGCDNKNIKIFVLLSDGSQAPKMVLVQVERNGVSIYYIKGFSEISAPVKFKDTTSELLYTGKVIHYSCFVIQTMNLLSFSFEFPYFLGIDTVFLFQEFEHNSQCHFWRWLIGVERMLNS